MMDVEHVERLYSNKDGVPVNYVCSTALGGGTDCHDIFFRETPHPEFGNRYFGLSSQYGTLFINNADAVEDLSFEMVNVDGIWYYSQHRHDFRNVGPLSIDGGRAYLRLVGENLRDFETGEFQVINGAFVKKP